MSPEGLVSARRRVDGWEKSTSPLKLLDISGYQSYLLDNKSGLRTVSSCSLDKI